MSTKKPRKSPKKATGKVSPPRARSEAEIKKIRAEIAESERRTQNRVEFIVEHQAKFSADIEKLNETVGRLANLTLARFGESNAKHLDTDAKIAALIDAQIQTGESSKRTDEKIAALVDAQIQTEEAAKKTDEKMAALLVAQRETAATVKKTSEAVQNLTSVVDRYLSERRNGN